MPPTILKQVEISEIERELRKIQDKTPAVRSILALVDRSKLFHLKHEIARARRAAHKALAGNDISIETWVEIQHALDEILYAKGEVH